MLHALPAVVLILAGLLFQCHALHLLRGERSYSAEPLAALYHTPSHVTKESVTEMLDVLERYGLISFYGVYALHTHLRVNDEEVLYLSQAPYGNFTSISVVPYGAVREDSIPMSHQLRLAGESVELVPIEHSASTDEALIARHALRNAIDGGLLESLGDVLKRAPEGHAVALSQILPIHRNALSNGQVVLNQLPDEERQIATIAPELGGASLGLFTRGVASDMACEVAAGCVWRTGVDGESC